jgi:hypothetical protein
MRKDQIEGDISSLLEQSFEYSNAFEQAAHDRLKVTSDLFHKIKTLDKELSLIYRSVENLQSTIGKLSFSFLTASSFFYLQDFSVFVKSIIQT